MRVQDQGTEGWVLTQIPDDGADRARPLAAAERGLAAAKTRAAELEQQVTALTAELGDTKTELDQTRENHDQVSQELADHAHRGGQRRRDSRAERESATDA